MNKSELNFEVYTVEEDEISFIRIYFNTKCIGVVSLPSDEIDNLIEILQDPRKQYTDLQIWKDDRWLPKE